MELKKPLIFLKSLPSKLNRFYNQRSGSSILIKNKSKIKRILIQLLILTNLLKNLFDH